MAARCLGGADLDAFLARHPWPERMLAEGQAPLDFLWRIEIDAPIDAMWPLLVDTSRFNRALGLAEMSFEERDGRLHGTAVNGGFRQTWIEVPWQWIHGREMEAVRDYSEGFGRWVRAIYEVEEVEPGAPTASGGFVLLVYFGWIPRGWLGRKILAFAFPRLQADYCRVLGEMADAARKLQVPELFSLARPGLDPAGEALLAAKVEALLAEDLPPAPVHRLADHLRTADELELVRLQPKALARELELEPRELLRAMLHATRIGLLDLSWDIVCPHCRGTREEAASLSRIPGESRCEPCELDFDTRAETSVEVTFRVNPAIHEVAARHWCAAEPAQRAHMLVVQRLEPGARRRVQPVLGEGLYRLRTRLHAPSGAPSSTGSRPPVMLELRAGASDEVLVWTPGLAGGELQQRGPGVPLELRNDEDDAVEFVLERAQWSDEALRPGDLLSLREFRDLFSEDYLAADVQLAVGMQTLLFTDMVGSTRFYATRGDADAFVQVRQHFAEIFEIVAAHDGVIVKTIGDAVMAAFVDSASAVRAAEAIQRRFGPEREDLDIRVRISLNRGPCIAVRFNTEIDYFGNAVNLAAKLQGCAGAGQVAISSAIHGAPEVADAIADLGLELESLTIDLPALGGEIQVWRWTTVGGADPAQSLAMPRLG